MSLTFELLPLYLVSSFETKSAEVFPNSDTLPLAPDMTDLFRREE